MIIERDTYTDHRPRPAITFDTREELRAWAEEILRTLGSS